jgi:hypothetical protein
VRFLLSLFFLLSSLQREKQRVLVEDQIANAPFFDGNRYFGTYSHVEMAASLLSATGSTQGMLTDNPGMKYSAMYHMYVTGNQGLFTYGDTGPNKYTATANGIMFYGQQLGASSSFFPSFLRLTNLLPSHRHARLHPLPARPWRRS